MGDLDLGVNVSVETVKNDGRLVGHGLVGGLVGR